MSLLDRYGMDEAERGRRQRFLEIDGADGERLRQLRPVFAAQAREFAERFYRHLRSNPRTAELLADPAQLERLKSLQAQYFAELLEGVFDAEYFEKRLRVGQAHQRVGLDPAYYLGAYNQYIQLTFPAFVEAFGQNLAVALPSLLALVKVIFLDIGLALDTYFQESTDQLRRRNEELQQALSLFSNAQRREEQMRRLLSHEVRGGLAAVITSLEDFIDVAHDRLDPAAVDQLRSASQRCWTLSNLLGEMLTTSQQGGPTAVETSALFRALASRFDLYTEGRDVKLTLPADPPRVWADPIQLREVFANLVANAVRYLDKDHGTVTITSNPLTPEQAPADHPPGAFHLFAVADNGPGLPEEVKGRLFEPFVRGPARADRPTGTGLGLYFVRSIVEQGGGRVWFTSTPGQGTCFHFTVPAVPPADPARSR
jgi:signal transduction histidine kinase